MSQWANENPERMAEIANLPPSQQNAELRHAIGYDPDLIRDRLEEERLTPTPPSENFRPCTHCGANVRKDIPDCLICKRPMDD